MQVCLALCNYSLKALHKLLVIWNNSAYLYTLTFQSTLCFTGHQTKHWYSITQMDRARETKLLRPRPLPTLES